MNNQKNKPNRLLDEKSPYLLQHAYNPVQWYPWGDEAFQRAAMEDKPIFLSIGYSTCHWCHVMAHESFEDEDIAAQLNRDFICIKVDREERPDVDAVYMRVCQAMTGSGGWPLTVLLTPEQEPFFAGTYFPKKRQYGQPGLGDILRQIADLWRTDPQQLVELGQQVIASIDQEADVERMEPTPALLRQGYQQLLEQFDSQWGGFGSAPKFPAPHQLLFLLRYHAAENDGKALDMVCTTLDAIDRGGIQDQIGGGFSRYSTDRFWLVPHFEKMLYDNALLLMAYLQAYQVTGRANYGDTARRTADYMLRELTDASGGFYCGQDADSDGVEGKYYVFTPQEIDSVLGEEDGKAFCQLYQIIKEGNFEGDSIPNRIGQTEAPWPVTDERLKKLYEYRRQRVALHKDDKVLLAWNSWAIVALAQAGRALEEPRYLRAAMQAQQFIEAHLTDSEDRLYLRWRDGEAANAGQLDDYAVYALALLELYGVTFQPLYLQQAMLRAQQMMVLFEDADHGGYYLTASDAEKLIARPKETYDGALPSGNSVAAMVLQRLALLSGELEWQQAAHRQLRFMTGAADGYPMGYSFGLLAMAEALYPHRELVCATREGTPEPLQRYLRRHAAYGLTVLLKTEATAADLDRCAPFTADYPLPEVGALYYLCRQGACQAPVAAFEALGL